MRTTNIQQLAALQSCPSNIRNICILAHVDHGKTTLADTLVASNGIISKRMAGKLRYMDSREDEQVRGITMKSSAISLRYTKDETEYLLNLIDSPGHIDFSSEVSTAVRLCDGAVVLVDVIEGVCPQTVAVLRQAWLENLSPVLVLNKIDRLMSEWKMTPLEAHIHLMQVLGQVNAVTGELFASEVMNKASLNQGENGDSGVHGSEERVYDWSCGLEESDDSNIYFSPDQGNVVFASALDGWGFGVEHFAAQWASKLGMNAAVLRKTLWGDFYLESKTKRIKKGAQAKGKKPLFVQFVLDQLWAVYEAITCRDKDKVEKIVKTLGVKILPRDSRQNDPHVLIKAVCGQWLPLSQAVLGMIVSKLPSPVNISPERVEKLLCPHTRSFDSLPSQTQELKTDFLACSSAEDAPVIVFVSKMFPVPKSALPSNRQRLLTPEEIAERRDIARQRHSERMSQENSASSQLNSKTEPLPSPATENILLCSESSASDQTFVAFARVFSGTVRKGCKLYVLGPKHDSAKALQELARGVEIDSTKTVAQLSGHNHITVATVNQLYLFMGRELEMLDEVPAGNVLGLGGLEEHILKSATLSSTVACPAFTDMHFQAAPIVRVAIEPKTTADMGSLMWGMRLLNQSDPSVEVLVQENGQHVIIATGEVHLQKCINDLEKLYAKIEVNRSPPIVPFRETIIPPPKIDRVNESISTQNIIKESLKEEDGENTDKKDQGLISLTTPNQESTILVRAWALPEAVTSLLESNKDILKSLVQHACVSVAGMSELQKGDRMNEDTITELKELHEKLKVEFDAAGSQWEGAVDQIWAFGPRGNGPNILLNRVPGYTRPKVWDCLEDTNGEQLSAQLKDYDSSIVSGFQIATLSGPLCAEPMQGVAFIVEGWETIQVLDFPQIPLVQYNKLKNDVESQSQSINSQSMPEIHKMSLHDTESSQHTNVSKSNGTKNPSDEIPQDPTKTGSIKEVTSAETKEEAEEGEDDDNDDATSGASSRVSSVSSRWSVGGPLSGQLMSTMKEACRRAFQKRPQRLMVAMYTCVIQVTTDVLGKMYPVIGKRAGRILEEDLLEGSSIFKITAVLPVIESFGFAEETRKRTSGMASPQLRFTHWEVVDIDPFWVPSTEEEYLHFGEKADSENAARRYMNNVRRRKGLRIDEKIVEFGEKQRTLKKNK